MAPSLERTAEITLQLEGNVPGRGYCSVELERACIGQVRVLGPERPGSIILSPGLVDIQLNGFAGVDFSHPQLEPEEAVSVLPHLWKTGVASFCPTLVTNSHEKLLRNFRVLERARLCDERFARAVPCYHLEGPYISPGGSHGAHDPALMRPAAWDEFAELQEAAGGHIGILTLAPEIPGALDLIARASQAGIVVAVAHTDGTPEHIHQAVQAGARLSTHLGNGCPQMIDRHANPLWAQLSLDQLRASLICDTFHLPPDLVKVIARMKGIERCILITDAVHVATLPPGRYTLVGTPIELLPGGKVIRADGDCLAGSAVSMNRVVRVFMDFTGASLADALRAATYNPVRLLGYPGMCAELAPGQAANLLCSRPGPAALEIETLYLSGDEVYRCHG